MGTRQRRTHLRETAGAGLHEGVDRPVVITTLATHNYLPRAQWCLEYLERHAAPAVAYLGAVGTDACGVMDGLERVGCYHVSAGMLDRSLGNPGNGCIQHGNWLPYIPVQDDDAVLICIDGDVKMQRPFSAAEWAWLQSWRDGQVGIGPNEPKVGGDNMINELCRIQPLIDDVASHYRIGPGDPIGNAGCIVATRRTWVQLWIAHLRRWLDTAPLFGHIAVQQWTINLCINEGPFERVILPQTFHTHGHWGYPGPPADGWGEENTATWEGETILFAHKTW